MTALLDPPTGTVAFDRAGNPIDLDTYVRLHRDPAYRVLAQDAAAGLSVMTVWLGVDQRPLVDLDAPAIYGTAIVDPHTGSLWCEHERFAATEEQAYANHAAAVDVAANRSIR